MAGSLPLTSVTSHHRILWILLLFGLSNMEKSFFQAPSLITEWKWNGSLDCESIVGCGREELRIEKDEDSLLFRTMSLRKPKPAPAKQQKKQIPTAEPTTTFLEAPIHKMTSAEVKKALKSIGLKTTGNLAELRERLEKFVGNRRK